MKSGISIFVLLVLIITIKAQSDKIIVPLNEIRNKSHVTVTIGNTRIPDILIDTGFPIDGLMIYNPDYKDSLNLTNARSIKIAGAGGGEASHASMIDSAGFKLGTLNMNNQKIILLEGDTYKGFPSNGIIGYSIFGHFTAEFNYDNNTLMLHTNTAPAIDSRWTAVPIYFKDNKIPWLEASVVIDNEKPQSLSMYIDYAALEAVLLLEKPDMKVELPKGIKEVYLGRGLSGDIYGKSGYISKLIIGSYELKNVKASIAEARIRSKQDNADAILGINSLRRFNLIFDYKNKKLFIKPNRHFDEPFE